MNFISKLFKKNVSEAEEAGKGSVEEFVSLIRVYYQAVMAVNLGITNLNMLADMALFKRMLKIPTQNNKLGVAEKSRVRMQQFHYIHYYDQKNRILFITAWILYKTARKLP